MTNSEMFKLAHKQTKADMCVYLGMNYKEAFGRALKGFYAVWNGYDGSFVR